MIVSLEVDNTSDLHASMQSKQHIDIPMLLASTHDCISRNVEVTHWYLHVRLVDIDNTNDLHASMQSK
jgi:hypothetical protein